MTGRAKDGNLQLEYADAGECTVGLGNVIGCLACPHCGKPLSSADGVLRCPDRHTFDVARQGYVSLLPGGSRASTADTTSMVEARDAFLSSGHFEPIAQAVAQAAKRAADETPGCVTDAGAGTGYYLAAVLDALPERAGIALDLSKAAARRAAKAHDRIGAVVADTWKALPVRSGSSAVVLDVFAPRNAAEFHRILAAGGALVVVTPTERHLGELVDVLGLIDVDEDKERRLTEQLAGRFVSVSEAAVERTMSLARHDVEALAAMGPSAWHVDAASLAERAASLPEVAPVTLSVKVSTYHRV